MIKLTDRLQVIADQIQEQETMADIGTDHGFLPISLWERGISPKVILADVSAGSLEKARENARQIYPGQWFDLRLGNGLQVLDPAEVDAVVIAGMGGVLMTQILGENLSKTRSFKKLILQPRTGQGSLRYWLIHNGFYIMRECLVREGKYICEVLTVVPGEKEECATVAEAAANVKAVSWAIEGRGPEDAEYEVPPWIFSAGALAAEFVRKKLLIEEGILNELAKSKTPNEEKLRFIEHRIKYFKSLSGGD